MRFIGYLLLTGAIWVVCCTALTAQSDLLFSDRFEELTIIAGSSHLNDTGIDWCARGSDTNLPCPQSGFPAQDGDVGRDALARHGALQKEGQGTGGFDFTKLDRNGNEVSHIAPNWSCVRDNHTGLIWEVKSDDVGDLRYYGHTYTWFSNDFDSNGGVPGIQAGGQCNGSRCDTEGYVEEINSQGLCGYDDWQLPTRMQLISIRHFGNVSQGVDGDYFPYNNQSRWWSNSVYGGDADEAWSIRFSESDGLAISHPKLNALGIRLVHGGK